jgi:ribulose-phosphate 3-epimerase
MAENPALKLLRSIAPTVSIGMMTADLLNLGSELALLERVGVKLVHVDVMDGVFCPMMTAGPPLIRAMKTPLLKDVHLMIAEPLTKVADYVAAGADIVTIHPEAGPHPHRTLQLLGAMTNANGPARGLLRGVALNPGTPLETLEPLMDELELISILAVSPGWGGQKFVPATFHRLARAREMIRASGREILLAVDGGITKANIAEVAKSGADLIVTGSAVFDGKAAEANARFMLAALPSRAG